MADKNEGFVFFQTYYEAMQYLPDGDRLALYDAICKYALYGEEPQGLPPAAQGQFILQRPNIDASLKRYKANRENGKKGGAPKGNQNAKKLKNNPKLTEKHPKVNLNKDKDKDKDKEMDKDRDRVISTPALAYYGFYKNVRLTISDHDAIMAEFPNGKETLEKLSEYMAINGKTYADHAAVIRKWAREDAGKRERKEDQKGDWTDGISPEDYEKERAIYGITI